MTEDSLHCPECGAALAPGRTCDWLFGRVLSWEQKGAPSTYAWHHVLVMCWELQHPSRFSDETLAWVRRQLRRVLVDGLTAQGLLTEARRGVAGKRTWKITRSDGEIVPRHWSRTLADVVGEGYDAMPGSIRRLAEAVLSDVETE